MILLWGRLWRSVRWQLCTCMETSRSHARFIRWNSVSFVLLPPGSLHCLPFFSPSSRGGFFLSAGQTFEVKQQSLISGFPLKMGYEPRINVVCRSCLTNGSAGTRERITDIKEAFANRYGGAAKLKVAPAVEGGLRLSRSPTGWILQLWWKFSLPSQIGLLFLCVHYLPLVRRCLIAPFILHNSTLPLLLNVLKLLS